MGSLEAIRFARHGGAASLSLLEQRKLPLETEWLDIDGPRAAWTAIREMAVRGAPAIAIAAALSLAVELVNGGGGAQFADAAAAVAHVQQQMDFLVTSRPTAVNLSIAAAALQQQARDAAAAPGATAASVTGAVVAACEAMLADDVAGNKAMGRHGADALLAAARARGRGAGGRLRVLTHCNTGSLATAAYGTALGVIRALHEQGRLEHAYCCETRPYNQGARLTAYELVHDGLPATLICDSAAAALMAQGRVDAVVVGADRIAANGDTANKIGTFCHAVAARHHDVPFFVAAPTTTLDPQLDHGGLIPIEERAASEVTHFRGQRVAADIAVWNPSFDVTPAALIEGIVTERGLVPRAGAGGFAVRAWLSAGAGAGDANGAAAQAPPPAQPGFRALDCDSVRDYVAARPQLAKHLGGAEGKHSWQVREVGDGNINFVYVMEAPGGGALCLKQALPYVRVVGESWPLTQDRVRVEAAALQAEAAHCPQHVPAVYHYDAAMCVIAMQYLPPPHAIVRRGLVEGRLYPQLARHLADFLAASLFHTSLLARPSGAFRAAAAEFDNTGMCRLTEQVIFTDPYHAVHHNRHTSPQLDADVAELRADADARVAAARLKAKFVQNREALLHGDLHTGSIMATDTSTYVIDPEFAFYGPMAFDVGKLVANLLLAFFACDGHASGAAPPAGHAPVRLPACGARAAEGRRRCAVPGGWLDGSPGAGACADAEPRTEQRRWLLAAVQELWDGFRSRFRELWRQHGAEGDAYAAPLFGAASPQGEEAQAAAESAFFAALWQDAVGFGGAVVIRRLIGIAHVADMDSIADADVRAVCERRALRFGRRVMVDAEQVGSVQRLVQLAEEARQDGAQPCYPL